MANWNVNDVIRLKMTWWNNTIASKLMNVLHYRIFSGSLTDAQKVTALGELKTSVALPILGQMPTSYSLINLHMQRIAPALDLETEESYSVGAVAGGITDLNDVEPQAAGCLVRKSFIPGRKGIGRFFFPCASGFTSNGTFVIDPAGAGDANTVASTLIASPTTTGPCTFRPVICAANGAGVTALNDVRKQTWALLVTYLKTRRQNVGI